MTDDSSDANGRRTDATDANRTDTTDANRTDDCVVDGTDGRDCDRTDDRDADLDLVPDVDSVRKARLTEAASAPLRRRDYLRALGATGIAGAAGAASTGSATAQSQLDEAAADQRIRENQQGPLTVEVVDQGGDPVSGAAVDVEMQEHDFVFGCEVAAELLVQQYDEGDPYIDNFLDLFNSAVLENIHKWAIWEGNQALADEAVDWLDERGYRIRGHTCIYSVDYAIPGDVQTAMQNGDGQTVRDRTMEHLREIITHYGDQIVEWDVVNEIVHEPELVEAIEGSNVTAHRSNTLVDWYNEADSVIEQNGLDVEIVTNDYNTLTWNPDSYYDQVEFMVNQGVDLDALCHQSHIGPSPPDGPEWSYASIDEMFQFYADLGPRQRITEFDMAGDAWTGYEQQARVLERFLKTAYGHPDVDEFTFWGFWDNAHWLDEAPFFQEDWSEKPALDVYRNLVFGEWWTSETGTTGTDGTFEVDAFLGEYEVTVSTDAGSTTETVSVTNADGGQRLVVSVEAGGEDPCDDAEPTPIDPYLRVDDGSSWGEWENASVVTIEPGSVVEFGPHPTEADGWSWSGPGVSGSSREIEVAPDEDSTYTATYTNDCDVRSSQAFTVTVDAAEHPCEDAVDTETLSEGSTVCDLDGDGNYRDVNGDGSVSNGDVVDFFSNQHVDPWDSRTDLFDFDGDGNVGQSDVVALFERVGT